MDYRYISAYPTFLSLQTSNVVNDYDDTDLMASSSCNGQVKTLNKWGNVIVAQSRELLAKDTSYLVVAILVLCLSESQSIKQDPLNFSIFNIVFEVIRFVFSHSNPSCSNMVSRLEALGLHSLYITCIYVRTREDI